MKSNDSGSLSLSDNSAVPESAALSGTARRPAASDRISVGVMGVAGRGNSLAAAFAARPGCEVSYVCDVDSRATERTLENVATQVSERQQGRNVRRARGVTDFRRILDDPDVDALVIAAADHWHTPATILALQAGKHVFVEKPASHNGREAELIVEAQKKYNLHVQMGNQQRSDPKSIQIIRELRDGLIGRTYYAHTWYANARGSIGVGREAEVPDWLDYELWQGPAPRKPYSDNVIHYNWHWFWHWGTGEICNNGTHELDIARWALGVEYPVRVTSSGGRYHFYDDWECFDTQIASFDFEEGKSITWHGRSCNRHPFFGRGRGTTVHGEKGTVLIDRNGFILYDQNNEEIRRMTDDDVTDQLDTTGFDSNTVRHIENFMQAIRGREELASPIDAGQKSVIMCHLGNIAQRLERDLTCDPRTGRILNDEEAMSYWSREYEPGWEPRV